MKIIIDANVAIAIILDEPVKQRIIELTEDADLISTEILPHEVGNALSAMCRRRRLTADEVTRAYALFETIPVRLFKTKVADALKISAKYRLYAYDAYYLELAARLRLPVLTYDAPMKNAGRAMNLEMWEG
jgi:predicted nucleic acid-binding protein